MGTENSNLCSVMRRYFETILTSIFEDIHNISSIVHTAHDAKAKHVSQVQED